MDAAASLLGVDDTEQCSGWDMPPHGATVALVMVDFFNVFWSVPSLQVYVGRMISLGLSNSRGFGHIIYEAQKRLRYCTLVSSLDHDFSSD